MLVKIQASNMNGTSVRMFLGIGIVCILENYPCESSHCKSLPEAEWVQTYFNAIRFVFSWILPFNRITNLVWFWLYHGRYSYALLPNLVNSPIPLDFPERFNLLNFLFQLDEIWCQWSQLRGSAQKKCVSCIEWAISLKRRINYCDFSFSQIQYPGKGESLVPAFSQFPWLLLFPWSQWRSYECRFQIPCAVVDSGMRFESWGKSVQQLECTPFFRRRIQIRGCGPHLLSHLLWKHYLQTETLTQMCCHLKIYSTCDGQNWLFIQLFESK